MESLRVASDATYALCLAEVEAAISLVAAGTAVRVRIACLPGAFGVASQAVALAQAKGVAFRLTGIGTRQVTVEIGPLLSVAAAERS